MQILQSTNANYGHAINGSRVPQRPHDAQRLDLVILCIAPFYWGILNLNPEYCICYSKVVATQIGSFTHYLLNVEIFKPSHIIKKIFIWNCYSNVKIEFDLVEKSQRIIVDIYSEKPDFLNPIHFLVKVSLELGTTNPGFEYLLRLLLSYYFFVFGQNKGLPAYIINVYWIHVRLRFQGCITFYFTNRD